MRTHHSIRAFPNKKPGRPNRQKHCLYGHVRKVRSSNFIHCATRAAIFSGLSHPFRPFACTEQQRSTIRELESLLVPSSCAVCHAYIVCVGIVAHSELDTSHIEDDDNDDDVDTNERHACPCVSVLGCCAAAVSCPCSHRPAQIRTHPCFAFTYPKTECSDDYRTNM